MVAKNKQSYKIPVKSLVIIASILVLGLGVSMLWRHHQSFKGTAGVSKVNYGPPTKAEKQAGNTQKEKDVQQEKLQSQTPPTAATIVITDASYYSDANDIEIRAYISNLFEDDGTCTATLSNGSQTVTRTSQGFEAATTTQCGAIDIPRSAFPTTGIWNLTLSYTSATAAGSQKTTVKL